MLFFINFALGACSGEYIGARCITPPLAGAPAWSVPRKVRYSKSPELSICRLATLERARASILEQGPEMPPLAGAPPWSAPMRVCWSIFQRSARMGLCRKSSYARRMPSSSSVL